MKKYKYQALMYKLDFTSYGRTSTHYTIDAAYKMLIKYKNRIDKINRERYVFYIADNKDKLILRLV